MEKREQVIIYEPDFIFAVAGTLFKVSPNRQPRKAETIMSKVRDKFRETAENNNEFYKLIIHEADIKNYIRSLILSIPEVHELKLSQNEYEQGMITKDDKSQIKCHFANAFRPVSPDWWRDDYVDLDAFVNNIYYHLNREIIK